MLSCHGLRAGSGASRHAAGLLYGAVSPTHSSTGGSPGISMQMKGSNAEQFWSFQPQALKALGVPNCAVPVPLVE